MKVQVLTSNLINTYFLFKLHQMYRQVKRKVQVKLTTVKRLQLKWISDTIWRSQFSVPSVSIRNLKRWLMIFPHPCSLFEYSLSVSIFLLPLQCLAAWSDPYCQSDHCCHCCCCNYYYCSCVVINAFTLHHLARHVYLTDISPPYASFLLALIEISKTSISS